MEGRYSKGGRIRFKRAPLYEAKAYHTNFIQTVSQIMPFIKDIIQKQVQNSAEEQKSYEAHSIQQSGLEETIKAWVKQSFEKKITELHSNNLPFSLDDMSSLFLSAQAGLDWLSRLLNATSHENDQLLNKYFEIDTLKIRKELQDCLQEVHFLLHLPNFPDQLNLLYEPYPEVCLDVLFGESSQRSLTEALFLDVDIYQAMIIELREMDIKNNPQIRTLIVSGKTKELLKICQDDLRKLFSSLLTAEHEVKKGYFLSNGRYAIIDSVSSYIIQKISELQIPCNQWDRIKREKSMNALKENKLMKGLSALIDSKVEDASSFEEISSYEACISSLVEGAAKNIEGPTLETKEIIEEVLTKSFKEIQRAKRAGRTLPFLLSERYLFSKLQKVLTTNSAVGAFVDLLAYNELLIKTTGINITFFKRKFEAADLKSNTVSSQEIHYVCSLENGFNFIRISSGSNDEAKLENYTQESQCANLKNVKSRRLEIVPRLESALEDLELYVLYGMKKTKEIKDIAKALRARILIFGYEENIQATGNEDNNTISYSTLENFLKLLEDIKYQKNASIDMSEAVSETASILLDLKTPSHYASRYPEQTKDDQVVKDEIFEKTEATNTCNREEILAAENEKLLTQNQLLQQKLIENEEICNQFRMKNKYLEERVLELQTLLENKESSTFQINKNSPKEIPGDFASFDSRTMTLFQEIITHIQKENQELMDQSKKDQAECSLHIKFGRGIELHQLASHGQNISKRMEIIQRINTYIVDLKTWSQTLTENYNSQQNREDLGSFLGSEKHLAQNLNEGNSEGNLKIFEEGYYALKKEVEFYRDKFFVWEYLATAQKEKSERQISELLANFKIIGENLLRKDDFTYLFLGNSDEFLLLTMKRIMEYMLSKIQDNRNLLQKFTAENEGLKSNLNMQIQNLRDAELKLIYVENELRILKIEHGNLKKSGARPSSYFINK